VLEAVARIPSFSLITAACVTSIFCGDRVGGHAYPANFPSLTSLNGRLTPGSLPPLEKNRLPERSRAASPRRCEVVFRGLFLVCSCWPQYPTCCWDLARPYLHASPFQLAPVWVPSSGGGALNVLKLGWRCVDLCADVAGAATAQQTAMSVFG